VIGQDRVDFGASTGDTKTFVREMPGGTGLAVVPGQYYVVRFYMFEEDGSFDGEEMGEVFHVIDTFEHGLGVGTHTARSLRADGKSAGDYTVTYEIRKVVLPDILPTAMQVDDRQGALEKRVCMAVQNAELVAAGPFVVDLRVDGAVPPGGRYNVGGLAGGESTWACVEAALPAGQHVLTAVVDDRGGMTEFNEANNVYEQTYVASAAPTAPDRADLTLSAIRVNGQEPNGQDVCKKGKNDLAVTVKNDGAADAGAFAVRLVIDGDDDEARVKQVADLAAGQEREVRFDDVRLKKGGRQLSATADAQQAVDETSETNNARTVSVTCEDD
jgi:subtilase family serine protease